MKLNFSLILLLFLCNTCKQSHNGSIDISPNIIFIIADDLGVGSLGCYGADIRTPNLDFWAKNGYLFEEFYATDPLCSPSRASIFTGQSPAKAGVTDVLSFRKSPKGRGLSQMTPTFAEKLKILNYETAFIGKWHLGSLESDHPLARGFDEFKGFLDGHIDYISHVSPTGELHLQNNRDDWENVPQKHLTSLLTDEAISFLNLNHKQPFCLVLSYANPHTPILLPNEEGVFPGQGSVEVNTPERYGQIVELLDKEIGRIQAEVLDHLNNTLVVFISDHGGAHTLLGNGPFQGGKGTLYEGGIKIPAIMYWPDKIKPQIIKETASTLDIYPTFLEIAGLNILNNEPRPGRVLFDTSGYLPRLDEMEMEWSCRGAKAIRKGKWKAIFISSKDNRLVNFYKDRFNLSDFNLIVDQLAGRFDDYAPYLFNLKEDPYEENNLSLEKVDLVTSLWEDLITENEN